MFENIGLRFALIVLGTFNQGWLMKTNWKLKLVETIPYLVLAITLLISVLYEKTTSEEVGRAKHGQKERVILKSVASFAPDHSNKK